MMLSQQRAQLHGQHLTQFKVLLHIGLWVAAAEVVVRMMVEPLAEEVEVLL
jgi:hypothetical protein